MGTDSNKREQAGADGDRTETAPSVFPPSHHSHPSGPSWAPFGWRGPDRDVRVARMAIQIDRLSDPAVRAFVAAVNAHDEEAFRGLLTPDATMADDGSDRDLAQWADREIFSSHGHMDVTKESAGGAPSSPTTATTPGARCAPGGVSSSRTTAGSPVSRPGRPETHPCRRARRGAVHRRAGGQRPLGIRAFTRSGRPPAPSG